MKLGELELFITNENPNFRNKITSKPLEDGADISDHIYQEPVEISFDFVVSTNAQEVAEKLREMRSSQEVYTYEGIDFSYENMAIKSLKIPRNKDIKDGFKGSIGLQQIRIVESTPKPMPSSEVQTTNNETPKREFGGR